MFRKADDMLKVGLKVNAVDYSPYKVENRVYGYQRTNGVQQIYETAIAQERLHREAEGDLDKPSCENVK
jgi:hypothetical protein